MFHVALVFLIFCQWLNQLVFYQQSVKRPGFLAGAVGGFKLAGATFLHVESANADGLTYQFGFLLQFAHAWSCLFGAFFLILYAVPVDPGPCGLQVVLPGYHIAWPLRLYTLAVTGGR